MNKVQRNAKAYQKLLNVEYIFYLAYQKKCIKVVLRFMKENFHHLEGLGHLKDNAVHSMPANLTFNMALEGREIYLFLDSSSEAEIYFPRSFVVAPELDYKTGQFKYTLLWKEKRNRISGESEVLYRFKEFSPENLTE